MPQHPRTLATRVYPFALALSFIYAFSQISAACTTDADGNIVDSNPQITIATSATLPNATVGVDYSQTLTLAIPATAGITNPTTVWLVTAGTLPTGFALSSQTGVLSSGPVTATPGTYQFGVQASVSSSSTIVTPIKTFTLTVVAGSGGSSRADSIAWGLSGADATRSVGQQWTYGASVYDQFRNPFTTAVITWVLSDPTVANVVSQTNGAFPGVTVQALKAGVTTIRPTIAGVTKVSPTGLTIVVGTTASVATTMTAFPVPASATTPLLAGSSRQFAVEVRDQNNAVMTPPTVAWSIVGTAGVASIDAGSGLATCNAGGTVTVRATLAQPSLVANATLVCTVVASILVSPVHVSLATTQQQLYTATVLNAAGTDITATAGVTFVWASSNSAVAFVNTSTGNVTAAGTGGAIISAEVAGVTGGARGTGAVSVGAVGSILAPLVVTGTTPVEGAVLTAFSGTVVSGAGVTNRNGRGYIPGLAPGTYTVTVAKTGFATQTFTGIVVTQNNTTPLQATITLVP